MASSRRSASDINILAMLDGLGARPHTQRHLLWYGARAVLACGLIGTLAWVVHEPATHLDSSMVAGGLPPAPTVITTASTAPVPIGRLPERSAAPLPAPAAPQLPAGGATIVNLADQPDPAPPSNAAADDPPRRILPAPKPLAAPHAPAPRSAAVHLPPARSTVASNHPPVSHPSPKRHPPAVKPMPMPAPAVDTDVALISAIIQHAASGREPAAEPGCADKACGPRMPAHP